MGSNYVKMFEKDYASLFEKYESSQKENKELKENNNYMKKALESLTSIESTLKELKKINEQQTKKIEELTKAMQLKDELIRKLTEEIARLKNNNKKDSSNSSKPSSTNGSKIIPNTREKSKRKCGGQKMHTAHTLKAKNIEKLLENKEKITYVENIINNSNVKKPKYVLDLVVNILVNKNITNNIDKLNDVQYGENIKSLVVYLYTSCSISFDQISDLISVLTNNKVNLSKGTLVNWINAFKNSLDDEIKVIENNLLDGEYLNVDDSNIRINGTNYYQLCLCNKHTVLLYNSKTKNASAWSNTILSEYVGILVKDGTRVFNQFNLNMAQCCSHIIRYLKGAYAFSNYKHKAPKKIIDFLNCLNIHRTKLINNGISAFSDEKYKRYISIYNKFISEWENELKDESKIIYKEEINLLERMKDKDQSEILFFLKDFRIPFTNNNAESSQRPLKVKQKIGKFRTSNGADNYCTIKSFFLTLKKRGISIIDSIKNIYMGIPVLAK